jgi:tRNA(Ile2) C34 agmatinyltransferase TiaS
MRDNMWIKILGFKPEKKFEPTIAVPKCYKCGNKNESTFKFIGSPAWTEKYKCNKCGYYTFIIHADFLSGALNEDVAIDKRNSAMDG